MISDELKKILEDDNDGLLDTPEKIAALTSDERLVNSFLEINAFYKEHGHAPSSTTTNITERKLYSRLDGMRRDHAKINMLKDFDEYNLLEFVEVPGSIDDVFDDDDLGLLDDDSDILTIKNVPKRENLPDYIGRQRPCKDFALFEHNLKQCHEDIRNGIRKLGRLKSESYIQPGRYYILRGMLVYVAEVGEKTFNSANRNKDNSNARLRLIYDNGTESDILLRSLARALYDDGKIVTETSDEIAADFETINEQDSETGHIYVLRSQSTDPAISNIQNLYKIGYSTQTVDERIKNAVNDPTYLMAPVEVVASYTCYNLTTQKFEHLLHRIFASARLHLEITDAVREQYKPDEWFVVPLDVIDQAVQLIVNGEIVHYEYDQHKEQLVLHSRP